MVQEGDIKRHSYGDHMNDKEREEWVLNDEGLYDRYLEWKKRTRRTSVRVFVQEHRKMIDDAVQPVLDGDKRAHHLKYG